MMNNTRRSVEELFNLHATHIIHYHDKKNRMSDAEVIFRGQFNEIILAERAYYEGEMKEFETLKELYKERCDNANLAWKKAEEWKGLSEKLFAKIGELEETITRLEAKAKKEMGE